MSPSRTSWRIVLVHTITFKQARQWVPVVLGIGALRGLTDGPWAVVALVAGITAVSLATAVLAWWRTTYADGGTSVVVTRGLLSRSVRTVPLDRVRGVEVEAPPLHRLFGLVRVRVDAAAGAVQGADEELVVDGLPRAEADRLRAHLLARRSAPTPEAPAEPVEQELFRFDDRWLLYAPLVGSYLAVPLAAVGALLRLADELPRRWRPDLGRPDLTDTAVVAGALVAVVVVLVVGSVVGSAVVNWRFRLTRRGGSLVAVRGLVTRRHTELEVDRIRGCTVSEGLGMRWVRAARATALVTGLGDAARRGQLLPLGPRDQAWSVTRLLVEDPGPLRAHPPAARRRRLVRSCAPGVVLVLAGAVLTATAGWWWVPAAGVVLAGLGVPLGLGRYADLGHVAGPRSFSLRSGWLVREQVVLQRRAVVGWQVQQSFFQRRQGVATVVAAVGAGAGGYQALDIGAADVAPFAEAASGPWAGALAR
ncbi:PH domain-containing protein [Klenkia brasiliensis]|uniref:Putative membrane protein n=1 Tax=Klenkia brasiliensis TaxID=333142 RepID=A0A1G7NAG1_9ACTN|nr:PH domain-containing protein [Klenkia brasiliensis]SDF71075.1 putative membrane protein [Klenkia brasiliensis]